ncbi:MAG: putative baseplate assembly protein [Acidimicrobiia bacterium]
MVLPAPNLDDRRFQDLVDDAKRLVQQRCPGWTDHNVSDPGVTLIETFAFMVDQLLYRLNRVPDRHYVKFLELIGVRLFPPTAARADVTFWLSAPQAETVAVPLGTRVATLRTETRESLAFTAIEDLAVVPCSLTNLASTVAVGQYRDHSDLIDGKGPFYCFDQVPKPGDALLVGLSNAVPSCAVLMRFDCEIEGVGVDPLNPPLAWEAWDGDHWVACDLDRDGTGGLNRAGDLVVHVPRSHVPSIIARQRAGWLRCRVVEAAEGQPTYSDSPRIHALSAMSIGGTLAVAHAEVVRDEVLGVSEGVAGQHFSIERRPVVHSGEQLRLEVSAGEGWGEWREVDSFAGSGPEDRHFRVDEVVGAVVFGPAVREADGTMRHYGAVPPKGAVRRRPEYWTGGGQAGNVARKAVTVLKSSIPYVAGVENRRPASGGVDGEDLENAKERGPLLLRTRDRAVTTEDYEHLAREAAPEVARVRCAPATEPAGAGAVRVLLVPAIGEDEQGRLPFEALLPSPETLEAVGAYLDERRVVGARVVVEPPRYQGITVVARIRARSGRSPARLQSAAVEALYQYFHPLRGGPDGRGWPFGRPVHVGEVYSVLQRLPGTEFVEDVRLFPADPVTGARGEAVQRLVLEPHTLVFSYGHQVRAELA